MKKLLSLLLLAAGTIYAQTPAFPGAEGHGRFVTGGRGGKVVHVTNLNDSGTGSFRQAVSGTDKKIVVFDVGGVIPLNSNVNIGANTTIMGQTAPKPGITLRYYTVNPNGNNIIVRYMRFRRGQEKNVNDGADASTARHFTGIIFDHCSLSWSIDEVASFYDNNNFTMQWCTIGESLCNAGHNKGAHGYGGIWGGKLASFHHNLICHVNNRSPRFNGARYNWTGYTANQLYSQYKWENAVQAENVDFRNCVVYNCGNGCYGGPGGGKVNMVGNYYKSGPAGETTRLTQVTVGAEGNASGYPIYWGMTSRYYVEGNTIDNRVAGWDTFVYDDGTIVRDNKRWSKDPDHYNGSDAEYITVGDVDYVNMKLDEPAPTGDVTTHDAAQAFEQVLSYAGASLYRDDVDQRYAEEAREGTCTYSGSVTGKPGRIDLVSDVNGYTEADFGTGKRPTGFDSDGDGMSDDWESANGLDPSKNDANLYTVDPYGFYTNVEVYCNSLVQRAVINSNKNAREGQAVVEYFPAYYNENEILVPAVNEDVAKPKEPDNGSDVEATLSTSTNTGDNTSASYNFNNGYSITNNNSKGYAVGNNGGIKYSAGVQYTIRLPEKINISEVEFSGYDNYDTEDAYLGEVNGVSYDATTYVFPKTKAAVTNTVKLVPTATGTITFTPKGKQVVLTITLKGKYGEVTAIDAATGEAASHRSTYNVKGQNIGNSHRGIVIKDGRKIIRNI